MIRVNLLATAPQVKRGLVPATRRLTIVGLAVLLATFASVGGWWWQLDREAAGLDARIAKSLLSGARVSI